MNFICSKEKLLENLNIVSRAVSVKPTIEILKTIYVEAKDNFFKLMANDLELGIESKLIKCKVFKNVSFCLDAKLFAEIVKHVPDDEISFTLADNGVVLIQSGKSEFQLMSSNPNEFPIMPIVEKENFYELPSLTLKNMIRQTIFSVSTDETKLALTGELMDIVSNVVNLVSIDGFRVSLRSADMVTSSSDTKVIIPAKTLNELSRILSNDKKELITIYIAEKHVLFDTKNFMVVSRLLEGEFMNYNQVFIDDYTTKVIFRRADFINCLERSSIIAKENNKNPIRFDIKNNNLVVTSNNEMGTTYEEFDIDMEGKPLEIAFNPRYLIDILKVIDEDEVVMNFTTSLSPCIIKAKDSTNHKYLLLPLRLRN